MGIPSFILKRFALLVFVPLTLLSHLFGCRASVVRTSRTAVNAQNWFKTNYNLAQLRPNEDGVVPILEYHNITMSTKMSAYEYPASEFRQDMEWLYRHNYRPIDLSDYARGWFDIPAGASPVVITFDDALSGQFSCLPNGSIDPNCAVGILDSMHKEHPDWQTRATFFVLTNEDRRLPAPFCAPSPFMLPSQVRFATTKMRYLVSHGYEIGNHTLDHSMHLRAMAPLQVEEQFAGGVLGIHKYLPQYNVQTLALPYGIYPQNARLVVAGSTPNGSYRNICAVEAGCQPAPSPMSLAFRPYLIPRIIPRNNVLKPGARFTIRYWLNQLELFPGEKFVSDGDPTTFTFPFQAVRSVDFSRLKLTHYKIRIYRPGKVVEYD
jgi:peptidoglycan/xylan/chitin deacetylase (PgdA/CDA1 family)